MPLDKVFEGEASPLRVLGVVKDEGFKLRDRAAHVYSEADRVYAFRAAAEVRGCRFSVPGLVAWSCMFVCMASERWTFSGCLCNECVAVQAGNPDAL